MAELNVLAARIELRVGDAGSLKAKRAALRPVLDRLANRRELSVAEVDHQDSWQLATLGLAVVATTPGRCQELLDSAERLVWSRPELEVLSVATWWLETD
ncbi:MAG: DUF503 domain-containing protein [Microthrixaceae bacterium]